MPVIGTPYWGLSFQLHPKTRPGPKKSLAKSVGSCGSMYPSRQKAHLEPSSMSFITRPSPAGCFFVRIERFASRSRCSGHLDTRRGLQGSVHDAPGRGRGGEAPPGRDPCCIDFSTTQFAGLAQRESMPAIETPCREGRHLADDAIRRRRDARRSQWVALASYMLWRGRASCGKLRACMEVVRSALVFLPSKLPPGSLIRLQYRTLFFGAASRPSPVTPRHFCDSWKIRLPRFSQNRSFVVFSLFLSVFNPSCLPSTNSCAKAAAKCAPSPSPPHWTTIPSVAASACKS